MCRDIARCNARVRKSSNSNLSIVDITFAFAWLAGLLASTKAGWLEGTLAEFGWRFYIPPRVCVVDTATTNRGETERERIIRVFSLSESFFLSWCSFLLGLVSLSVYFRIHPFCLLGRCSNRRNNHGTLELPVLSFSM